MKSNTISSPRERILSAAKTVFAAHGYRGGSLNDVAMLAGYTRAGLLHHYRSKESMLLALLEQRDETSTNSSEIDYEHSSLFAIMESLPQWVGTILEDKLLIKLAHALTAEASEPDHPAHDWVAERQKNIRERLERAVLRSVQAGELPETIDRTSLAAVILGAVEGLESQWLIDPSVDPIEGAQTLKLLILGLRAK